MPRNGDERVQRPLWQDETRSDVELLATIAAGELDKHLIAIADAVNARRELLYTINSASALARFRVGDSVRINRRIRPRYLCSEFGEITEVDEYSVTVCLWRPVGRFYTGQIRCPPLALERVSKAECWPAA